MQLRSIFKSTLAAFVVGGLVLFAGVKLFDLRLIKSVPVNQGEGIVLRSHDLREYTFQVADSAVIGFDRCGQTRIGDHFELWRDWPWPSANERITVVYVKANGEYPNLKVEPGHYFINMPGTAYVREIEITVDP